MGRLFIAWWLLGAGITAAPADERFEFAQTEMAIPIKLVLYAPDDTTASTAAQAAFNRIHYLNGVFSDYEPESELRRLTRTPVAGRVTPVSEDLWNVLACAQELSQRTEGAFDVTVGPLVRQWRRARRRGELPSAERLAQEKQLVGFQHIQLHPESRSVELRMAGMQLDLGGIAKGYVLDAAMAVLRQHGIHRALIDAGGDVVLGDPPPDKSGWTIGIAPLEFKGKASQYLSLSNVAVATSGDMFQFVEIDGKRYSHIVDPRTGVGLTDHSKVTIVAPCGMMADSLATAVSVLGPQKGLALIEATPPAAALIMRAPEGEVTVLQSSRWKELPTIEPEATGVKPSCDESAKQE
jgi:thiamine biosynthesis lipoprotein